MNILPALARIDSYKLGHMAQYPKGTEFVYSNLTPRSMEHLNNMIPVKFRDGYLVAYGMEMVVNEIHEVFDHTFFNVPFEQVKLEFLLLIETSVGPSGFDINRIRALHELGYLPLSFKTLPEGTIIKTQIPVLTVVNTDPNFEWLPNFIETWLSASAWKPMVAATIARYYRKIMGYYAEITGTSKEFVDWQGHDFSSRGMSGIEDAATTGTGHLLFFKGTDNISAQWKMREQYDVGRDLIGGSVPATEHSVMCMGGRETEIETFYRLITSVYPNGVISIVSDTWDFWKVITEYAVELKEEILARGVDSNGLGKVVFRPDSGDPVDILCGTALTVDELWRAEVGSIIRRNGKYYTVTDVIGEDLDIIMQETKHVAPEVRGAVDCLWEVFGGTYTSTGHRQLHERVGLIYGDSITMERADTILNKLAENNYASGNIVLGIGSYTYQHVTRDTLGIAMKATWGQIDGKAVVISKNPITDPGKRSAYGLLAVLYDTDYELYTKNNASVMEENLSELKLTYTNGIFCRPRSSLLAMRHRVMEGLNE